MARVTEALHPGSCCAACGLGSRRVAEEARTRPHSSEHRRSAGPLYAVEIEALVRSLAREVQRGELVLAVGVASVLLGLVPQVLADGKSVTT